MKRVLFLFIIIFMVMSCNNSERPHGKITIQYEFTKPADVEPSYQTAIWLLDENGQYLQTFLVSEYLSYGGYNDDTICSDWINVSDWDNQPDETYDAVTKATPRVGINSLVVDCKEHKIIPGKYTVCIQTHILEDYNIFYKSRIDVGSGDSIAKTSVTYVPQQYKNTAGTLKNVSVKFTEK